ncbi:hypothetical protein ACP70R_018245 [Stipagrostis hirtigluma subsp. patula]
MKKPNTSAAAAVDILPDDLLGDALARLPDLPSLASAALVSKRWRRVASDPAILRRFHSLRRPPLVGVILSDRGDMPFPGRCPNLRFVASHTRDPRLLAAAGAGDFLFGGLPDDCSGENNGGGRRRDDRWRLRGCDGGLLLLSRGGDSRDLAVYDPFARTAVLFAPPDALRPWCHVAHYALVADDTDASFRVIAARFGSELKAAVFSSRSQDWVPVPSAGVEVEGSVGVDGVRAGRFVHWRSDVSKSLYYIDEEEIVVLDTDTMRWSVIDAPFAAGEPYCVADVAEHGGLCLVSSKEQLVRLWVREGDEWVIKKEVSLLKVYGFLKKIRREEWMKRVRPLAMRGDYVLMEFWSIRRSHSYLLMLNLKTMKLDMFHNDATQPYRGPAFPFFMPSASPRIDQRTVNVQGA